jgi:hypothetical protein
MKDRTVKQQQIDIFETLCKRSGIEYTRKGYYLNVSGAGIVNSSSTQEHLDNFALKLETLAVTGHSHSIPKYSLREIDKAAKKVFNGKSIDGSRGVGMNLAYFFGHKRSDIAKYYGILPESVLMLSKRAKEVHVEAAKKLL